MRGGEEEHNDFCLCACMLRACVCVCARLPVFLSFPVFSPLPVNDLYSLSFLSCLSSLFLVVESQLHISLVANIFVFTIAPFTANSKVCYINGRI